MIQAQDLIDKFKYALDNKWGYILGTAGETWTAKKQQNKVNFMVTNFGSDWKKNADAKNSKWYMAAMYGAKWENHTVADCSGLFVWAFKQLGGSIYHGSNTMYRSYCTTKGKLTDSLKKTLVPGTSVYTGTENDHGHVGLYVGNGKVIEAHGTQAGVCTANITENRWTYYGLLKGVEYGENQPVPAPSEPKDDKLPTTNLPTLKRGSTGEYVALLQTMLANKGYDLGKYGVDSDFGSATLAAVKAFQKANGLAVDGIVGKNTWGKLLEQDTGIPYYTVTIPHLTDDQVNEILKLHPGATKEIEKG